MRTMHRTAATARQAGIVSIMVTMIIMIVISLLVLGFAEISRNEQRSSLDDQLSAEAYYAAESGVNDARAIIAKRITSGLIVDNNVDCRNLNEYAALNPVVDAAHGSSYTCVLVNATPTSLFATAGFDSSVIPIMSGGAPLNTIKLDWQLPGGGPGDASQCTTPAGTWSVNNDWLCDFPVLRVDLLNASPGLTRGGWDANTSTIFFVPSNVAVPNTVSVTPVAHGTIMGAQCASNTDCIANISGMTGSQYYMRVTTLYQADSKLTITAGGVQFHGGQATIDVTGKAQDVLRRIQVAIDLTDANKFNKPSAALITEDSVCKRFATANGTFKVYDNMTAGGDSNPLCDPASSTP